jgi:hypothetical protein
MKYTIRLTERLRCKQKEPSYSVHAASWPAFVEKIKTVYSSFRITFTKNKARINEGATQTKITWEQTT